MNIKTRLAFQFTLIFTGTLLFFSMLVYYFSYTSQLSKFRQNLLASARNNATLLINVEEVDSILLHKIQQSTTGWVDEEMAITDSAFSLVYGNKIQYLKDSVLLRNSANNSVGFFSVREKDGVCYMHTYRDRSYFVYALAYDVSRRQNLAELRRILLWSVLFSIWLSVLFSYMFAKRAIRPISKIVRSVKEINSLKLNSRLDEGDRKDEIAQLAITFNELLTNLEKAFKSQEDFVSNASHELRTPLSIMIGESDYVLNTGRTREEYLEYIRGINADLKRLNSLVTNLLDLARISSDKSFVFARIRIDEIIFGAIFQVRLKYSNRKIIPKIHYPENPGELIVWGNEGLLSIALTNLLDNACKFSENDVVTELLIDADSLRVVVTDSGIGIPENEIENILHPFSRASNVKYIGGFGLGLALVKRIMELHRAEVKIRSRINEGTSVEIVFRDNRHQ